MPQNRIQDEITGVKAKIKEFKKIGCCRSLTLEEELDLEELEMDLDDLYELVKTLKHIPGE